MEMLTYAVCTYNRAGRLPALITAMKQQECPVPFEILVIDNNSSDDTQNILSGLSQTETPAVRYVKEHKQGITHARNRALEEAINSTYLVFIDDDEIPRPGLLKSAIHALHEEAADCVGGRVQVMFEPGKRPKWLSDDLLGFLAEIDYGENPFWISSNDTPVWTANVGYNMSIFRNDSTLRFNPDYNREGKAIGGGEDIVMFEDLLKRNLKIRYQPAMIVEHYIEEWRLKRSYFLKLHFCSGKKSGQFEPIEYSRTIAGIPLFMFTQALRQSLITIRHTLSRKQGALRQAMNAAHAFGTIWGRFLRWRSNQ